MKRGWVAALILFGLTSLLADVCYEGFRGILGPLALAETRSWLDLGLVLAEGEAINWGLRLPAALLADKLRAWWGLTILGYALTPIGVAVALLGGPLMLALGVGLERLGKTLRGPARDALLSGLGGKRGLVYAVHEAMDQVGAVAGPLLAYYAVATHNPLLIIAPGAASVAAILAARLVYPGQPAPKQPPPLALYARFTLLGATTALLPHPVIIAAAAAVEAGDPRAAPLAYTLAMLVDAAAAIPLGRLYDKLGPVSLAAAPVASLLAAALLATRNPLAAMIPAGVALAAYETVYRAYVADRAPVRATGFGSLALGVGLGQAASAVAYAALAASVYPAPLATSLG